MELPVMPPVQPMLAKSVKGIPDPEKYGGRCRPHQPVPLAMTRV